MFPGLSYRMQQTHLGEPGRRGSGSQWSPGLCRFWQEKARKPRGTAQSGGSERSGFSLQGSPATHPEFLCWRCLFCYDDNVFLFKFLPLPAKCDSGARVSHWFLRSLRGPVHWREGEPSCWCRAGSALGTNPPTQWPGACAGLLGADSVLTPPHPTATHTCGPRVPSARASSTAAETHPVSNLTCDSLSLKLETRI